MRAQPVLNVLVVAAALAAVLVAPAAVASAQQFPVSGSLDELERAADRMVAEQQAEAARAEAAAKRAQENEERWKQFEDFIKDRVRDIERSTTSREHRSLVDDLTARKAWYVIGILNHNLGNFRDAEKYFKTSLRSEAPNWQAASHVMLARLEMISVFDGKDPSGWERRIDRELEKTREQLNSALDKLQIKLQDAQNATGLGDMNEYFGNLKDWLRREHELKQAIQKNTWDSDSVWSLIRLYRDNLDMLHLARAWCELFRERFKLNARTLSGEVDTELAKILIAEGHQQDALKKLEPADDIQAEIDGLKGKIEAIEKKIADANARGERANLSDEEMEISKLDPNRFKNEQRKNFNDAQRDVKRVNDFLDNAAGRRRDRREGHR